MELDACHQRGRSPLYSQQWNKWKNNELKCSHFKKARPMSLTVFADYFISTLVKFPQLITTTLHWFRGDGMVGAHISHPNPQKQKKKKIITAYNISIPESTI